MTKCRPAGNGTFSRDLPLFSQIAQANAYLAASTAPRCGRFSPGCPRKLGQATDLDHQVEGRSCRCGMALP